jgi:hypothetical protein
VLTGDIKKVRERWEEEARSQLEADPTAEEYPGCELPGAAQTLLAAQPPSAHAPLEPALRDYILLITILVALAG